MSSGEKSSSSTRRKEKRRSVPRLVLSFTSTGIMRGVWPIRPAMAVVRSWSTVPTASRAVAIFQDCCRLGKTE